VAKKNTQRTTGGMARTTKITRHLIAIGSLVVFVASWMTIFSLHDLLLVSYEDFTSISLDMFMNSCRLMSSSLERRAPPSSDDNSELRILIYVTTHVSDNHLAFVEQCWPYIAQNTQLIGMSDILIFSTSGNATRSELMASMLRQTLGVFDHKQQHNVSVIHHMDGNPGYHQGANLPLKEASIHGWFRDYDWIVRVNPDVLIYDVDSWILDTMRHDKDAEGIFADCADERLGRPILHSDFWAVRATAFPEEQYSTLDISKSAEEMTSRFFYPLFQAGKGRLLPNTGRHRMQCRTGWKNQKGSPVIHNHNISLCPQPTRS
jgi:hypothetical protein